MNKKIIIFSGPSAVGKGTIEKSLFANKDLKLKLSVSATTREKREGEIDGVHYYFVPFDIFETFIKEEKFLEYSKHFDNYYGTLKSEIQNIATFRKIPFIEIETNGAKQIIDMYKKENKEAEICSIFLMPPSMAELRRRMQERNTESENSVFKRLDKAKEEIELSYMFEHVIVNYSIDDTVAQIEKIIKENFNHIINDKEEIKAERKA
ncbi:Guanylate kinase [Metamycoplasma auris 15026]|uniref:Guanylate kinase n=1 Tax=Metamycoplasma auris 15026 TaxID=1188233 RepID=N9V1G0_9BACT|nr:guanylate kinase [Metamycoplasma auris]ENY69197.1 Guanylate kinase [Metamycoplasma auris 15026]